MAALDELLPKADQDRVVQAIGAAEKTTSGEIKVHVESRCKGDPYRRAIALFERLGLTKTRQRNAVLIYVAVHDRKYALLGDSGIHEAVGSQFWNDAATRMQDAFRKGALGDGLVGAVESVGARLAEKFPPSADDKNEISDEISTDKR
jgi:uncharacterized membrane protein